MTFGVLVFGGLENMLSHPFIRYGLVAGTAVAVAAGLVGYFLVLRVEVFTTDALSHVSFTGALGALAFGLDAHVGLFASTIGVGLLLALLGRRGRADDVVIGNVFAWVLGLGVLFLSIFTTSHATGNSVAGVRVLFGSIFGLTRHDALIAVIAAAVVVCALAAIGRPLLFATIDEDVAAARGVPVRALGLGFAALVAVTVAEAAQVVGALLLIGLVTGPPAAASRLTARPRRAIGLSVLLSVAAVWIGLAASYAAPRVPPSFAIVAAVAVLFMLAAVWSRLGVACKLVHRAK
jgi:zinc/manganese transport system permease protein